jgi:hypothetical protein
MVPFKKFLQLENCILVEKSAAGPKQMEIHLTHLEDLAIEKGKRGFAEFITTVDLLIKKLSGQKSSVDLNAKIDGSPALLFGRDPREEHLNQFFIALKYVVDPGKGIIKEGAKLLHSESEIMELYGDRPSFASKLVNLFKELNRAYDNSGLIYQCDVLFSSSHDKQIANFDGEDYIMFKPNVIVYAIPVDPMSDLYNQVNNSEVGIVVHDSFSGIPKDNFIKLQQKTRRVDSIINSGKNAKVFIMGANFAQAKVDVDSRSINNINKSIATGRNLLAAISDSFDDEYVQSQVMEYLKIYINKQIDLPEGGIFGKKFGEKDLKRFLKGFTKFLENRFEVTIGKKKTERGRANQIEKLKSLIEFLNVNNSSLLALLQIFTIMVDIKKIILTLVERVNHSLSRTFFEEPGGTLVPTKGEGHVVFNGDTHVKIVDRLEFTKVNRARGGVRS